MKHDMPHESCAVERNPQVRYSLGSSLKHEADCREVVPVPKGPNTNQDNKKLESKMNKTEQKTHNETIIRPGMRESETKQRGRK
eukprot:3148279-Amphidinium_carterae.1